MATEQSRPAGRIRITARHVRRRYGDVSDMTIWRWLNDPELGFPQPEYINGRRYWFEDELNEFDRRRKPARKRSTENHVSA